MKNPNKPSPDDKSLQDKMNLVLIPLGLEGWKAMWEPDTSQKVNGRVIVEQKTIIVFTKDPEKAKDVFLHEVIEIKIQPLITQYQETINGLIKIIAGFTEGDKESQETVNGFIRIIERLTYLDKERVINTIVPLIRHVFGDNK